MNKLAIYVEGETEQIFAERLVREMAGHADLHIVPVKARGGVNTRRRTRIVQAVPEDLKAEYYVLLVDCSGDGGVKSRLLEEHPSLVSHGYHVILTLRDVPKDRTRIERFREGFPTGIPADIPAVFTFAIMEIEAWFLAEYTHFQQIDVALTQALIVEHLGFDPTTQDMREIDRPARVLAEVYALVNQNYRKGRAAQHTIYRLDLERLVTDVAASEPEITRFVNTIAAFFERDE